MVCSRGSCALDARLAPSPLKFEKSKPHPHMITHLAILRHDNDLASFVSARLGKWIRDPPRGAVELVRVRVQWCSRDLPFFVAFALADIAADAERGAFVSLRMRRRSRTTPLTTCGVRDLSLSRRGGGGAASGPGLGSRGRCRCRFGGAPDGAGPGSLLRRM